MAGNKFDLIRRDQRERDPTIRKGQGEASWTVNVSVEATRYAMSLQHLEDLFASEVLKDGWEVKKDQLFRPVIGEISFREGEAGLKPHTLTPYDFFIIRSVGNRMNVGIVVPAAASANEKALGKVRVVVKTADGVEMILGEKSIDLCLCCPPEIVVSLTNDLLTGKRI